MKGSIICILIPNYSLGKQWGYTLFCLKDLEELNWTMFFLIRKTLFFQKKQKHVSLFDGTAKLWVFSSIFILLMYCRNSRF